MPEKFDDAKISAEGGSASGGENQKESAPGGENLPPEEKDKIVGEAEEEAGKLVETKNNIEIPKSKTLGHFWNGIATGKYEELADDDISKMIENVYLSEPPLTQLT